MGFSNTSVTWEAKNSSSLFRMTPKIKSLLFLFAKRFIAGQTFAEALPVLESLKSKGFSTTVDHLGEDVTNPDEAKKATDDYIEILKTLKTRGLNANISVKLTQLGLAVDRSLCLENLKRITVAARDVGGFVRADMEGSAYTSSTLDIVKEVRAAGGPVGVAIQAMLRRTPADVALLIEHGITLRLCKGAYKEPIDVAYRKKTEVERQYVALMKRLLVSGFYHGIATHDKKIIEETKTFAAERDIGADQFEFQMLLGIKRGFQQKIVQDGFRLRVYVPFGRAWLPYVLRRLRERKENIYFVLKNLFGE